MFLPSNDGLFRRDRIWEINTRSNSEVIRKKLISNYHVFSGGVIPGGSEQKEMLQDLQRIL